MSYMERLVQERLDRMERNVDENGSVNPKAIDIHIREYAAIRALCCQWGLIEKNNKRAKKTLTNPMLVLVT